jgi:hypothetical protein
MKFSLVFENSGDSIPFTVVANSDLFEFFVDKITKEGKNYFSNKSQLASEVDKKLTALHWAISKTNEVLYPLIGKSFEQKNTLEDYLNQDFLNKTHADWVFSQYDIVDIDKMRFSNNHNVARIGNILHELYPDEIRQIKTALAMEKLGYIYPYEEVNMSVHRLEQLFVFDNLEFSSDTKWEMFDNPFRKTMVSNNNVVNFAFSYTYVGRQYYDKFNHFDDKLQCKDHYNFETLENSFHISLQKPQTIPYSEEFTKWAKESNVELISKQLPIANIDNLSKNLFEYRKVIYRNSKAGNQVTIKL